MLTAKNKQSKFKRHSSFVFCQITSDIECGSLKCDKKDQTEIFWVLFSISKDLA